MLSVTVISSNIHNPLRVLKKPGHVSYPQNKIVQERKIQKTKLHENEKSYRSFFDQV